MSYFKEMEFETKPDPNIPKKSKPTEVFDKEKLKKAEKLILEELEKIKTGASRLTTYAINPGSFGFPMQNQLRTFIENPNYKNYKGFCELAIQDFGAVAGVHFIKIINNTKKEKENE